MQKLVKVLLELVLRQYLETRRSGNYMPIHLAPTEGWGALWALLGAFGPLFITIKLYFESEFPFLGGFVL